MAARLVCVGQSEVGDGRHAGPLQEQAFGGRPDPGRAMRNLSDISLADKQLRRWLCSDEISWLVPTKSASGWLPWAVVDAGSATRSSQQPSNPTGAAWV